MTGVQTCALPISDGALEVDARLIVEVFTLLISSCMTAVAFSQHSAPPVLCTQHSENTAQNAHQQDKPGPDELHRPPLTLVQCAQKK